MTTPIVSPRDSAGNAKPQPTPTHATTPDAALLRTYVHAVRVARRALRAAALLPLDERLGPLTDAMKLVDRARLARFAMLEPLAKSELSASVERRFWLVQEIAPEIIELALLRHCMYPVYLNSDHWQTIRSFVLARARHRCQVCNSTDQLNVHHRTYARRGAELPEDMIVLCRSCHVLFHQAGRLAR